MPLWDSEELGRDGGLNELMNELERWANFYLTMSAAAATLLGLMFVVITLAATLPGTPLKVSDSRPS